MKFFPTALIDFDLFCYAHRANFFQKKPYTSYRVQSNQSNKIKSRKITYYKCDTYQTYIKTKIGGHYPLTKFGRTIITKFK